MAETYGIFDIGVIPARKLAVLAIGLRPDSRIYMALTGDKIPLNSMLLAACLDNLAFIAWSKTMDGQKNRKRPRSILDYLINGESGTAIEGYATPKEFEAARLRIMEGE